MRPVWARSAFLPVLVATAVGCGGSPPIPTGAAEPTDLPTGAQLADEDRYTPSYGKAELQRALITERGAEASGERVVAELAAGAGSDDRLRVALADLEIRRRFIATLEACEATGRTCPPRLDDPPWAFDPDPDRPTDPKLDAPLRFDLESWRKVAFELFGRACACRTIACVDSMTVAIDQLEARPMPEVQGDDDASLSITRARECLFRLRGRRAMSRARQPLEE